MHRISRRQQGNGGRLLVRGFKKFQSIWGKYDLHLNSRLGHRSDRDREEEEIKKEVEEVSAVHGEESCVVLFNNHKVFKMNSSWFRSHFPFDFQLSKLSHGTWNMGGGKWDSNEDSHLQNIPYQKPELEDEQDEDKDFNKSGDHRADTAGSERVAEGIVADEVTK